MKKKSHHIYTIDFVDDAVSLSAPIHTYLALYTVAPHCSLSSLLVVPHSKLGSQSDHDALRLSARQAEWLGPEDWITFHP